MLGQVTGFYTFDTGHSRHRNAVPGERKRYITPIGQAVVTGLFDAATGTLKIAGPEGKLFLVLTASPPVSDGLPTGQAGSINPGGPMIPASTGTSRVDHRRAHHPDQFFPIRDQERHGSILP